MKYKISLALTFLLINLSMYAQGAYPWTQIQEKDIQVTGERLTIPQKYLIYQLDAQKLASILRRTPQESFDSKLSKSILSLPAPNGNMQEFYIFESSVMHPDLARKYPEIKSYLGYGVKNSAYYLRFDVTPAGFHAMVLGPEDNTYFIDPMAKGDQEHYISYYKKDYASTSAFNCPVTDIEKDKGGQAAFHTDCSTLRRYDLAMAATGEFTSFNGGTVAGGLAAINTIVTRLNAIYERDLHMRFRLVEHNDEIIFTDAANDPYSGSIDDFLSQNQTTCNNVIGSPNYDVGHLVHKASDNGKATLSCACNNSTKARGTSWHNNPVGDPFVVDYTAHEMGHQFGGTHTQNTTTANCGETPATAAEPGSASTIMGYAGICAPYVQVHSDDYFHGINLFAMAGFIMGNQCPTMMSTHNMEPTVDAGPDRTFPKGTPFVLTAVGSDPNDPVLTYCWEQMDTEQATSTPPASTATGGPVFRSFSPTTRNSRWFPRFADVLANVTPTWEVLPSVGRNLNFTVTVRDNYPGGGCTDQDEVLITINNEAGPFRVISPNSPGMTFCAGSSAYIAWAVDNTNIAPVSCPRVDIFLSTDGGLTFPTLLQSAVPNTGSSLVNWPIVNSNACRIMVMGQFGDGNQNTFYDISNADFAICTAPGIQSAAPLELLLVCFDQETCYTFPSTGCVTGFTVQSQDPYLIPNVIGLEICLTNVKHLKRISKINVTPIGPCGTGQTQQWSIYVDFTDCGGLANSPSGHVEDRTDPGENIQVFVNEKPYLFEDVILDGTVADNQVNIEVYDVQGKLLLSNLYDTTKIDLEKSSLPAGVLILKINYQGKQITDKILNFRN